MWFIFFRYEFFIVRICANVHRNSSDSEADWEMRYLNIAVRTLYNLPFLIDLNIVCFVVSHSLCQISIQPFDLPSTSTQKLTSSHLKNREVYW